MEPVDLVCTFERGAPCTADLATRMNRMLSSHRGEAPQEMDGPHARWIAATDGCEVKSENLQAVCRATQAE